MSKKLQLTLAILKPDLTLRPYCVDQVRHMLLQNDFIFVKSKEEHLDPAKVKSFYQEHQGKFFYNRLVTYMSRYERKIILYNLSIFITSVKHLFIFSGCSHIHILGRNENAIQKWRTMMGPTKVFKTRYEQPNTIRGLFGITDTRNSSHGSDSEETARQEIQFFFPEFDFDNFYRSGQDQAFLNGQISQTLFLDQKLFQHFVKDNNS